MDRRDFVKSAAALVSTSSLSNIVHALDRSSGFPRSEMKYDSYIEEIPVSGYRHAPLNAYEAFQDMKFGCRIHWGIYSIWHRGAESWPFLDMPLADRQIYNNLYKSWNPIGFDAEEWMNIFSDSGMRMFAFTTKHHEGFAMFDSHARVKNRANWIAAGGPQIEECDVAYSIMETPFGRDVVKELCEAAHKRGIKIDLYFSHPDWYDADFRPYVVHPLQVPSAADLLTPRDLERTRATYRNRPVISPDPTAVEMKRMMERHRAQLVELLTRYGRIDMLDLDMWLGPAVWPELRKTILKLREIQPDVMLRDRGIGNYGDYYTPERVVPASERVSEKPWFCIYPLGTDFSYEADEAKYKGTAWIVHTLIDTVAKGGGLMVGVGPNANGRFHPVAIQQMKQVGDWLKVNGEAIYATRPRSGDLWSEGNTVWYTRSKDRRFVYALMHQWPGRQITLTRVRPRPNSTITLLGTANALHWTLDSQKGTTIDFPESLQQACNQPCEYAWSLKVPVLDV